MKTIVFILVNGSCNTRKNNGVYSVVATPWIVIPASPVRTWLDTPELLGNGEMVSHEILIPVF